MIGISHSGNFDSLENFIKKATKRDLTSILHTYGKRGVAILNQATPRRSGLTSSSWSYEIRQGKSKSTISWLNTNVAPGGPPVAILIQYGHGTRTGGYVSGIDFINPALQPLFDQMASAVWKEVTNS